jgi:hypothetical protein
MGIPTVRNRLDASTSRCVSTQVGLRVATASSVSTMSFSQYWHQVPGWAKKVLGASLLIGATLVGLGLLGDHHKVWEHWSFGANFYSSVAGAFFGIPFAAVVVTWFTAAQERRLAQEPTRALSRSAWSEFRSAVSAHAAMMPAEEIRTNSKALADAIVAIREKAVVIRKRNPEAFKFFRPDPAKFEWGADETGSGFEEDFADMMRQTNEITKALTAFKSSLDAMGSDTAEYNRAWAMARHRWQFLSTTVRTFRLSADLGWGMPEESERDFVFRFNSELSPIHGTVMSVANQISSIVSLMSEGIQVARTAPTDLIEKLSSPTVNAFDSKAFIFAATNAAKIIEDLTREVDEVDAAWPSD